MFHTIVSIKNDGHYFCRAGGNRPDGLNEPVTLKQRLAEQEALIHALQEKLSNREREIDHLHAQLDKLRRMNFGSRSEKVSRRIAQMEADLNRLQKESDRERYADW